MDDGHDTTAERVARNDSIFRDANEQIAAAAADAPMAVAPFLCECADPACTAIVRVALDDYERIRSEPRRFFSVPGHEDGAHRHARVVRREDGYIVVEKVGRAGEIAEQLDARTGTGDA